MRGYVGITDRQWFNNLKSKYVLNEVNFWRKNTNSFKSLEEGEKFFFLVKNQKNNKEERVVLGAATFVRYEVLSITEAWIKYKEGNGVYTEEQFLLKMKDMYKEDIDSSKIGCIILKDINFFSNGIILSKLNIEFQNSIVSGKSISEEEVNKILAESNINDISVIKESSPKHFINEQKLHNEFWQEFINVAFKNSEFKDNFYESNSRDRSYYDLFWGNKDIHLCLRHNIRDNYVAVEIYIEEEKKIYEYSLKRRNEIESIYGGVLKFTEAKGKDGQDGKASKIYDKCSLWETCDRSNWHNYIEWLKTTSLKMKEIVEIVIGKVEEISNIDEKVDINDSISTTEWMVPCNIVYYDVIGAFNEFKNIEWKQSVNISVNDIVYIYVGSPYKEIKYQCIARKVDLPLASRIDDSKFIIDNSNYKNTGRYMELELLEKYKDQELSLTILKENGIKSVQGPCRINNELSNYINLISKQLEYEREVISIPAAGTIDLIYKYGIHAHPNDGSRYPYKKSLLYTFREKDGVMSKLYELISTVDLNPKDSLLINELDIDMFIKERLRNYIEERKESFTFHEDGEYKFYILSEPIELINKVALPKQNNHTYFTVDEIYSGKYYISRSNNNTRNSRSELIEKVRHNSKIDYVELDYDNFEINKEIIEGNKVTKLIEVKKRNSLARKLKLESFKASFGKVFCEVCGIEDEVVLDIHHDKISVADMEDGHVTKLEDLRVICANCHRKVHGNKITVDRLIEIQKN